MTVAGRRQFVSSLDSAVGGPDRRYWRSKERDPNRQPFEERMLFQRGVPVYGSNCRSCSMLSMLGRLARCHLLEHRGGSVYIRVDGKRRPDASKAEGRHDSPEAMTSTFRCDLDPGWPVGTNVKRRPDPYPRQTHTQTAIHALPVVVITNALDAGVASAGLRHRVRV